jgi:hypothetical protein
MHCGESKCNENDDKKKALKSDIENMDSVKFKEKYNKKFEITSDKEKNIKQRYFITMCLFILQILCKYYYENFEPNNSRKCLDNMLFLYNKKKEFDDIINPTNKLPEFILNTEKTQNSIGKTYKLLMKSEQIKTEDILFSFVNNSLIETEQLIKRMNDHGKWEVYIISSKSGYNLKEMKDIIKKKKPLQKLCFIMCTNKTRIYNVKNIIEALERGEFKNIEKINLAFDEVDKTLSNTLLRFIGDIKDSPKVREIIFQTATPDESFWNKLKTIDIQELLNMDNQIYYSLKERSNNNYRSFGDHEYHPLDGYSAGHEKHTASYIVDNLLNEISHDGRICVFAPAEYTTKHHDKMCRVGISHNLIVLLMNGVNTHNKKKFKGKHFHYPNGKKISIKKYAKKKGLKYGIDHELRDVLLEFWNDPEHRQYGLLITGHKCVTRGITFNTKTEDKRKKFNFTHAVFPDIIFASKRNKNNSDMIQKVGRTCGHENYVDKMHVYCSTWMKDERMSYEMNHNKLKEKSPESIKPEDCIYNTPVKRDKHRQIDYYNDAYILSVNPSRIEIINKINSAISVSKPRIEKETKRKEYEWKKEVKKRMLRLNNRYSIMNSGKHYIYIINKNQLTEEKENQIKELIDSNKKYIYNDYLREKNEFTWQEISEW